MFSLPNLLTLSNLLSGCIALLMLVRGDIQSVTICIGLCLLFDFLDGLVARLLRQHSEIGKELDSLADMVSFGLLPGIMYYIMLLPEPSSGVPDLSAIHLAALPAFLVPLFSALRLAKFNTDQTQSEVFLGMPTPANTILTLGLLIAWGEHTAILHPLTHSSAFLYAILGISSILLILPIPMLSLKSKNTSWKDNSMRYILAAGSLSIFILSGLAGLALIIIFYLLLSALTFQNFTRNSTHKKSST